MINQNELLFVVDENNNPVEPLPRSVVHEKKLWHRTSHVWVINDKKQLLCHKRSMLKDISPGNWDPYFGGHLKQDLAYEDGAVKELKEEVGIQAEKENLHLYKIYKNKTNVEFQGIFIYKWIGNIELLSFEVDEVDSIAWFPIKEVKKLITEKAKDWSQIEYGDRILTWLLTRKTK